MTLDDVHALHAHKKTGVMWCREDKVVNPLLTLGCALLIWSIA